MSSLITRREALGRLTVAGVGLLVARMPVARAVHRLILSDVEMYNAHFDWYCDGQPIDVPAYPLFRVDTSDGQPRYDVYMQCRAKIPDAAVWHWYEAVPRAAAWSLGPSRLWLSNGEYDGLRLAGGGGR